MITLLIATIEPCLKIKLTDHKNLLILERNLAVAPGYIMVPKTTMLPKGNLSTLVNRSPIIIQYQASLSPVLSGSLRVTDTIIL